MNQWLRLSSGHIAGLEIERKKARKKKAQALFPGSYVPLHGARRGGYHNVPPVVSLHSARSALDNLEINYLYHLSIPNGNDYIGLDYPTPHRMQVGGIQRRRWRLHDYLAVGNRS